jgi:hypothetical protein
MPASSSIVELRNLLATRFPQSRFGLAPRRLKENVATGVPGLDRLLGGGLPRGEFTELVASSSGSGSVEVLHELLRQIAGHRQFLALVDGMGSFDVGAVDPAILSRLLWVRCQKVTEALKAMDLLLRDRNFSILVLDLKLNSGRELGKISASVWHRYDRLLEQNQATVLVLTPWALVGAATVRVQVEARLGVEALAEARRTVLAGLSFRLLKSATENNQEVMAKVG